MMRFVKETLLKDWRLKITSILLALILWQFVRGDAGAERVITIPLEAQIPRDMEITNERPTSVDVTLRGAVSNMWLGQPIPTCLVDLRGASQGEHVVPLMPDNVQIPRASGIEVLKVNPARVTLFLESTMSREVPILVPVHGEPARGYEFYSKTIKPASVVITGPRSHLERVREVSTEAVSLNDLKQFTRMFVSLNIRDAMVRASISSPIEVDIQVGPLRKVFTMQLPVLTADSSFTTVPHEISVQLLVPPDFDTSLIPPALRAMAMTPNPEKLPCREKLDVRFVGKLDPGVTIKDIEPNEVYVRKAGKR